MDHEYWWRSSPVFSSLSGAGHLILPSRRPAGRCTFRLVQKEGSPVLVPASNPITRFPPSQSRSKGNDGACGSGKGSDTRRRDPMNWGVYNLLAGGDGCGECAIRDWNTGTGPKLSPHDRLSQKSVKLIENQSKFKFWIWKYQKSVTGRYYRFTGRTTENWISKFRRKNGKNCSANHGWWNRRVGLGGGCGRQITDSNPVMSSSTKNQSKFQENRAVFMKTEQFSFQQILQIALFRFFEFCFDQNSWDRL
jgi:hypothetical protein